MFMQPMKLVKGSGPVEGTGVGVTPVQQQFPPSRPYTLTVYQHGSSLLQAVGGAIPCLAHDTNNLAVKGPDNIINTILVMKIQILVHFHFKNCP